MPYECGITPESDARARYTVRFYLVAPLFVVFDVETVFLYPWAVEYRVLGLYAGRDACAPGHPGDWLLLDLEARRFRMDMMEVRFPAI
jgi:hypothetical protein